MTRYAVHDTQHIRYGAYAAGEELVQRRVDLALRRPLLHPQPWHRRVRAAEHLHAAAAGRIAKPPVFSSAIAACMA